MIPGSSVKLGRLSHSIEWYRTIEADKERAGLTSTSAGCVRVVWGKAASGWLLIQRHVSPRLKTITVFQFMWTGCDVSVFKNPHE